MDNNEVYALFEDIKSGLKSINSKLENTPKVSNNQSDGQPPAMDLAPIKELLNTSARENREQTKAILTKFGEAEVYTSNRILNLLRDLKESFTRSANGQVNEPAGTYPPPQLRHKVKQGVFLFGRHECRLRSIHLGKHRALAVEASVCG